MKRFPEDRSPRRLRLVSLAVTGALILPTTAGCSSSSSTQYANCLDSDNNVVDAKYCDDPVYYGGGGYFLWMAPLLYSPGYRVPSGTSISRFSPGDSTARVGAGLPGSGKVGGTSVSGGGIGKGSGGGSVGS